MTNKFIFHGVGQGLFYSGHIADGAFNFVYDCGSTTVNLANGFPNLGCQDIDFVVISHLHDDHINGLPFLLHNYNVKEIILPYFDAQRYREVFIAYLIGNGIFPNGLLFNFLLRCYNCEYNDETYTAILEDIPWPQIDFISSSRKFLIYNHWQFNFYNKLITNKKLNCFENQLNKLLNGNTIEQYIKNANGNYNALKSIFSTLFSNLNLTSLVLMHWNINQSSQKTLLTGDIRFDKRMINRIIKDIGDENNKILFHIPHHGAAIEWNAVYVDKRIIDKSDKMVISYGINNAFGHPSIKLLRDCCSLNILNKIECVNEYNDYQYPM